MRHAVRSSALQAFLEHPRRPTGTLRYHQLQGFLFAIASAPELVPPSEWMPLVFGGNEPEYENLEEAKAVIGQLMAVYSTINAGIAEHRAALPEDCVLIADASANLDADAPVSQWSRGFLRGHQWLEEMWEPYLAEELDEEFGAVLMALTFFASRDLAAAFCEETGRLELVDMASRMCDVFDDAIAEYAHLGRSIHTVLMEQAGHAGQRSSARIGRNDPCPCGSGRKYKRCCGGTRQ